MGLAAVHGHQAVLEYLDDCQGVLTSAEAPSSWQEWDKLLPLDVSCILALPVPIPVGANVAAPSSQKLPSDAMERRRALRDWLKGRMSCRPPPPPMLEETKRSEATCAGFLREAEALLQASKTMSSENTRMTSSEHTKMMSPENTGMSPENTSCVDASLVVYRSETQVSVHDDIGLPARWMSRAWQRSRSSLSEPLSQRGGNRFSTAAVGLKTRVGITVAGLGNTIFFSCRQSADVLVAQAAARQDESSTNCMPTSLRERRSLPCLFVDTDLSRLYGSVDQSSVAVHSPTKQQSRCEAWR